MIQKSILIFVIFYGIYTFVRGLQWPPLEPQDVLEGDIVLNNMKYPFMAYLVADENDEFICGGALASSFFVLTTAECLVESWASDIVLIDKNSHYIGAGDGTVLPVQASAQERRIEGFHIHPDYNKTIQENSIGLIKATRPFDLGERTVSAALLTTFACDGPDPLWQLYQACILVEFGKPKGEDRPLRKRIVPVLNMTYCEAVHRNLQLFPNESRHVCTRDPSALEAPCGRDGGGLLVCGPIYNLKVYGVMHRRGEGCGLYANPEVYTKVSAYEDWLDEQINKTFDHTLRRYRDNSGGKCLQFSTTIFILKNLVVLLMCMFL